MMTREEAIEYAESKKMRLEALVYNDDCKYGNYAMYSGELSFVNAALSALRPVGREQVEKVWRGEWMGSADGYADGELVYDTWECSHCGYVIDEEDDPDMLPQFCTKCYAAMTDKAVDMVMERLNKLEETKK